MPISTGWTEDSMASEVQVRIATMLGLDVLANSEGIAAARIMDEVAEAVGERGGRRLPTTKQIAFAESLGLQVAGDSFRVISAKIDGELRRRNLLAIGRLGLKAGDRVLKRSVFELNGERHEDLREFTVSSIRPNTRVFFRGGNGQGAWPTQLEKVDVDSK